MHPPLEFARSAVSHLSRGMSKVINKTARLQECHAKLNPIQAIKLTELPNVPKQPKPSRSLIKINSSVGYKQSCTYYYPHLIIMVHDEAHCFIISHNQGFISNSRLGQGKNGWIPYCNTSVGHHAFSLLHKAIPCPIFI